MPRAHYLHVTHDFAKPVGPVFEHLSEHENLGGLFGAKVQRLNDGDTDRNGVGSRRRLQVGPTPPFEETVVGAAAVVVAANHDEFTSPDVLRAIAELTGPDALIIDPWNCFGSAQIFGYVSELSAITNAKVTLP